MPKKPLYLEIFSTSLAALLLEISYTRIFSFKLFYYFTYLILGLGLLGIGAGGIALATSERLRRAPPERLIPLASIAGGASMLVSYLVVAPVQLNITDSIDSPLEIGKVVLVSSMLTLSFFAVGVVLSAILSARPESASTLYAIDLLGAALGCTLSVPLVSLLSPPRSVVLAGLVFAAGGLRLSRSSRRLLGLGLITSLILALPVLFGSLLPDPVVAKGKSYEDFRKAKIVEFSKWSPVFRIDVAKHPFLPGEVYLVFHDGLPGSGLRRFDGDFKPFEYLRTDSRSLPFEVLPSAPHVLIIGAAGGHEVVASLFFNASRVTGVELNPVTYSLLTSVYADVTGHLAENPRVTLINGDGRWFLKQSKEHYDLIWFVAPDSYAAMNAATSGAFVLSESYLYTVEMVKDALSHLSEQGIICAQFGELNYERKPNRTTRYLSTARVAFEEQGITDFWNHVMVASSPGFPPFEEQAILLSKKPFDAGQQWAFAAHTQAIKDGVVRYAPERARDTSPVNQVVALTKDALKSFYDGYKYQVGPVRDDSPFFWHFASFRDVLAEPFSGWNGHSVIDYEDSIAEQVTLVFLGVALLLAALFLLSPLVTIRGAWAEMPHKAASATYFAALGLGFMFLEVALIQKLTLLLGYPTYSLSVTLFALLVFCGLGSLLSSRYTASRDRILFAALAALGILVLLAELALPAAIEHFVGRSLPVRIAVTIALVAPLGLCLGTFMPVGLRSVGRVTPRVREYVAWAWAVNGFFSVIASILSTILAMVIGFRMLFLTALAVYAVGVLALRRLPDVEAQAG